MASLKQILEKHFFSFLDENGLESLKEKMIETIIKAEYELDDVIERMVDVETHSACTEVEHENSHLHETIDELKYELRQEKTKEEFFVPQTLQDEFKIQWIKNNWDKIPTI
jgi:hypothetical protein